MAKKGFNFGKRESAVLAAVIVVVGGGALILNSSFRQYVGASFLDTPIKTRTEIKPSPTPTASPTEALPKRPLETKPVPRTPAPTATPKVSYAMSTCASDPMDSFYALKSDPLALIQATYSRIAPASANPLLLQKTYFSLLKANQSDGLYQVYYDNGVNNSHLEFCGTNNDSQTSAKQNSDLINLLHKFMTVVEITPSISNTATPTPSASPTSVVTTSTDDQTITISRLGKSNLTYNGKKEDVVINVTYKKGTPTSTDSAHPTSVYNNKLEMIEVFASPTGTQDYDLKERAVTAEYAASQKMSADSYNGVIDPGELVYTNK